jgi:hypothetical protein
VKGTGRVLGATADVLACFYTGYSTPGIYDQLWGKHPIAAACLFGVTCLLSNSG